MADAVALCTSCNKDFLALDLSDAGQCVSCYDSNRPPYFSDQDRLQARREGNKRWRVKTQKR